MTLADAFTVKIGDDRPSSSLVPTVTFATWVPAFAIFSMARLTIAGHNFTFVDFSMIIFSIWQIASYVRGSVRLQRFPGIINYLIIFGLYILLIVLSFIHAGDEAGVVKELWKWLEILGISLSVCLYIKNDQRFVNFYWSIYFFIIGECVAAIVGNALAGQFFERLYISVDFAVILAIPFLTVGWIRVITFGLLGPALILTYSRLSWIDVTAAALIFAVVRGGRKISLRKVGIFAAQLIIAVSLAAVVFPKFGNIVVKRVTVTFSSTKDQSQFTRRAMDYAALLDLLEHPISGVGAGNFKAHLVSSQTTINFWLQPKNLPNSPHNAMLQAGAELGFPGILAMLALQGAVIAGALRLYWRTRSNRFLAPYGLGILLFVMPLVTTFLFDNIGEVHRPIWGIFFGLALAGFRVVREDPLSVSRTARRWPERPVGAPAVVTP